MPEFMDAVDRARYNKWPKRTRKAFETFLSRKNLAWDPVSHAQFDKFCRDNSDLANTYKFSVTFVHPDTKETAGPYVHVVDTRNLSWFKDLCLGCGVADIVTRGGESIRNLSVEEMAREKFDFVSNTRLNKQDYKIPKKYHEEISSYVQMWWSALLEKLLDSTISDIAKQCVNHNYGEYLNGHQFETSFSSRSRTLVNDTAFFNEMGLNAVVDILGSPKDIAWYLCDHVGVVLKYILVSTKKYLKQYVSVVNARHKREYKPMGLGFEEYKTYFFTLLGPVMKDHEDLNEARKKLIRSPTKTSNFKVLLEQIQRKHVAPLAKIYRNIPEDDDHDEIHQSINSISAPYYYRVVSTGPQIHPNDFRKLMNSQALTPNYEIGFNNSKRIPDGSVVVGDQVFRRQDLELHHNGQDSQIYLAPPKNQMVGLISPYTNTITVNSNELKFREVYDPSRHISVLKLL